jgi:hypothetical protein
VADVLHPFSLPSSSLPSLIPIIPHTHLLRSCVEIVFIEPRRRRPVRDDALVSELALVRAAGLEFRLHV